MGTSEPVTSIATLNVSSTNPELGLASSLEIGNRARTFGKGQAEVELEMQIAGLMGFGRVNLKLTDSLNFTMICDIG